MKDQKLIEGLVTKANDFGDWVAFASLNETEWNAIIDNWKGSLLIQCEIAAKDKEERHAVVKNIDEYIRVLSLIKAANEFATHFLKLKSQFDKIFEGKNGETK